MRHLLGSTLLIAGTTIGAAMLALPMDTGAMGFFPAAALFIVIWLGLMATAFYFMEVALHSPKDSNMITMAGQTLGPLGKGLCAFVYILLLYALVCSYLSGGASALHAAAVSSMGIEAPFSLAVILFCLLFGLFIYLGTASVDRINQLLFLGLILSFFLMIGFSLPKIDGARLLVANPQHLFSGVAIVITSFGFHIVIPTLRDYLGRNVASMKKALWVGGSIPLLFYLVWNAAFLGLLPRAELEQALRLGELPQAVLARHLGSSWIATIAGLFSFFAIITSFLGVSISLLDFIADGLKIHKGRIGRLALCLLVFLPPVAFVLLYPRGFYLALRFGGVMVAILLGIFPPLMALAQRKRQRGGYKTPGGRGLIYAVLLFFLALLAVSMTLVCSN